MARDGLDDKALKSDPYQEFAFQAIDYVYKRRRRFIAGGALLVAIVAAGAGYFAYRMHEARTMADAFNAAETVYSDTALKSEERIERSGIMFREFLAAHPDAKLAPFVWVYLAAMALERRDPEDAEKAYRNAADHPAAVESLRVIAQTALAKIDENRGDYDRSADRYQALPDERYGDLKALSLGRIALARNRTDEARRQLESLTTEFPDSLLAPQARVALSYSP